MISNESSKLKHPTTTTTAAASKNRHNNNKKQQQQQQNENNDQPSSSITSTSKSSPLSLSHEKTMMDGPFLQEEFISMFYKPHTASMLVLAICTVTYFAVLRTTYSTEQNIKNGLCAPLFVPNFFIFSDNFSLTQN